MGILGFTDIGRGRKVVSVDHDPRVAATDVPEGSLVIYQGEIYLKLDDGATTNVSHTSPACLTLAFTFSNNGAVLNTGVQEAAYLEVPCTCEITRCRMYGGPSGSIQADLWVDTYGSYPPTVADTIVAAAPPTISGGVKSEDTTLTGWTETLAAGSGILANIDSVTNMTWAKLVLFVEKR